MTKLADYRLPAPGAGLREGDPIRRYVSVWRRTAGYWSLCRSYPLLYLFSSDYFEDGTGGRKIPESGDWLGWFEKGVNPND